MPYKIKEGPGGKPKIEFEYMHEDIELSAVECTAAILKKMKKIADEKLNTPVSNAVITVPAGFTHLQRQETHKAACLAGFSGIRIMHQPTAAAIVYANLNICEEKTYTKVCVFNMGGTSIDISIIQIEDDLVTVKASDGDPFCGGEDFDNVLVTHLLKEFEKSTKKDVSQDARARIRLHKAAEKAKELLS